MISVGVRAESPWEQDKTTYVVFETWGGAFRERVPAPVLSLAAATLRPPRNGGLLEIRSLLCLHSGEIALVT